MIEILIEPMLQFGALGAVLIYFMFKDYKTTPKIIESQKKISDALVKISIIIDERIPK